MLRGKYLNKYDFIPLNALLSSGPFAAAESAGGADSPALLGLEYGALKKRRIPT